MENNKSQQAQIISLDNVDYYNKMMGLQTYHPLVAAVDLREAKPAPREQYVKWRYGLYALFLKHGTQCSIRYGRQKYDYQEGTVVSFAPGQVVEVAYDPERAAQPSDVQGLLFHPDLIYGTPLGQHIGDYHFFDYESVESLHLSEREQQMFIDTLRSINQELQYPVDPHSQTILVDRIKLLLDYCRRFYDRQFITRHKQNSGVLVNFEQNLRSYFSEGTAQREGLPTVAWFADKACLSPGYFGDLVKRETGLSAQQYIQRKVVSLAKQLILDESYTINQIADTLGFQYPQHFTRFFKRHVGMSPRDYRGGE